MVHLKYPLGWWKIDWLNIKWGIWRGNPPIYTTDKEAHRSISPLDNTCKAVQQVIFDSIIECNITLSQSDAGLK
jgi:hypothetical protein